MVNKGVYTFDPIHPRKSNIDTKNDPFETQTKDPKNWIYPQTQ